jgi:hypothetical protein
MVNAMGKNDLTGVWLLTKYVTGEYTRTGFDEDVIVIYCPNGRHLSNPLKTKLDDQTNAYTLENDILAFFKYDPQTSKRSQNPYMKYRILTLTEHDLVMRVIEVDGHPPKSYQVVEQTYKKLEITSEFENILNQCR